ncbi:amidase [Virgisporangium aliadipatigenens]|uniref:Amidase n=1 Tax=Virgisporangium aliadipatigenens TaxID=741659 RepID=A0A8J3YIU6_9ACTN|nr:amidase [Virgisporangium aliadipatigenens]GIJ45212.1 amidase [Virgisporangium aliadipatigenens]
MTRSAAETARLIADRSLSSREVVAACLARIAETNPSLNAVCALRADAALAEAEAADRRAEQGEVLGPLHGVPFTVKDWLDVATLFTPSTATQGSTVDGRVPARDATAVARLRAAGGILLGKTAVGPDDPAYGRVNNPHNPEYGPAGSSSGEAAVIGAGGSPLGLGSDSGGSIRQPAHCCGIAGLRPTSGRVPLTGHYPFISALNDPRTVIGPLARHVEDLALALRLIAGPDGWDPSAVPVPCPDPSTVDLRGTRVGLYTEHPDAAPDPACVAAVHAAGRALEAAGLIVEEATPPGLSEVYPLTLAYWRRPESLSPDEWVPDGGFDPAVLGPLDAEAVERSLFEWDRFRRRMLPFLNDHPLVLSPAAEKPAVRHGEDPGGIPYTLTWSLLGNPAAVVPAGSTVDGLPVGVQIAAAPWREDLALAAAAIIEAAHLR